MLYLYICAQSSVYCSVPIVGSCPLRVMLERHANHSPRQTLNIMDTFFHRDSNLGDVESRSMGMYQEALSRQLLDNRFPYAVVTASNYQSPTYHQRAWKEFKKWLVHQGCRYVESIDEEHLCDADTGVFVTYELLILKQESRRTSLQSAFST